MNSEFKPRKVEPKSCVLWFKNGLELASRKPLEVILLVVVFSTLHYLPNIFRSIFVFVMPLLLGAGCIISLSANEQTPVLKSMLNKPKEVWARLLFLGFFPWIPLMVAGFILFLVGDTSTPVKFEKLESQSSFEGGAGILALMFLWFITIGYYLWFMIPLISVAELPLKTALDQAIEALFQNRFVIALIIILSLSCFLGMILSVLVFPWVAIVTGMMYVSFLDIWLGGPGIKSKQGNNIALSSPKPS